MQITIRVGPIILAFSASILFGRVAFVAIPKRIADKGRESGEAVGGIDVVFDDVEGEVVGPAEGPNGDGEEDGGLEGSVQIEYQARRQEAEEDEQGEFEPQDAGAFDVGHGWRISPGCR